MNNTMIGFMALMASIAAMTDLPERMKQLYDESVLAAQQIATAGDLRSMSEMLDVHYITKGQKYPLEESFKEWLDTTFRENNLKDLRDDHWGNSYIYIVSKKGKAFELRSVGPDGVAETDDDMVASGP